MLIKRKRRFKYRLAWSTITSSALSVTIMNVPKEIVTYCPRCNTHKPHSVSLYREGKRRALAEGERRHERRRKGYGGRLARRLRRTAKTTKKQTLKLRCSACGYTRHREGIRLRKLNIT